MEEVEISNIPVNLSDKDKNVNMGEGISHIDNRYNNNRNLCYCYFDCHTTTIVLTTTNICHHSYIHFVFSNVFWSHSTELEKSIHEEEADIDDMMVSFADLQFMKRMMYLM